MKAKVTILAENSVFSNIGAIAEHGWSAFIETPQGNYLFDTGQGKALLNNAKHFNKDLASLKGIMLSHHHIDHTGGLMKAIKAVDGNINVYAHPDLFKKGYMARTGYKYIGIPNSQEELENEGAVFKFNTEFTEIIPNMYLTGEVPRLTDFEYGDTDIGIKTEKGYVKDPVMDDQSVIIDTEQGLFIILGCAHAGIINILNHAKQITGKENIHTVIGGTHLWCVSEEQKQKSIQALLDMDIQRIGVSHCTGFEVGARLAERFKERFFYCNVGTVVEV